MAKKQTRKDRDGVVYSTNENFEYNFFSDLLEKTDLAQSEQLLKVQLDKKSRGGKKVTLITGFECTEETLKELGKKLKSACGVGGSAKDDEIMVQGDFRDKIVELLEKEGYKVKRVGG